MNKYAIKTGRFFSADGSLMGTGWAGQGEGKNNPDAQDEHAVGPLPVGFYTIGAPYHNSHTGPYTMDLTPDPDNEMMGRSLFRIHGAALENPELSSEGCIVQARPVRESIWDSGDHQLEVVSGE